MNNPRELNSRVCTLVLLLLGIGNSEVSAFVPSQIAHQIDGISSGRHGACSHPAVVFAREQSEHVSGRFSRRNDGSYQSKLFLASKKAGLQENSHHRPEKSKQNTKHVSPHQIRGAFNALLDKLAKEESAQSAERAESMLFDRLRSAALDDLTAGGTNASDLPYDVLSFNIVLNAWSKALNAPRAEALLGRMAHMHEKGILPFGPNEVSYSTVADAWKRMPGDDAENNVEEVRVLDLMHEMEDDDKDWPSAADLKEDLVSFNQELDLFAREGFPEAAETAEMMLFDSIREAATASDGSKHIGCDIISFNTVLNCWAKLGNPQRADALLSRLEHLSDIGVLTFGPNSVSFATVISSWANSKLKRAPYECEALLDKIEGLCEEDDDDCVSNLTEITPTIHMYAATITAWSRSKRSDAAHRAEQILGRLERLYKAKNDRLLKPNSVLCTAIIQCWGRCKDADALDRAEAIFQRMKKSEDPDMMPTEHTAKNTILYIFIQ